MNDELKSKLLATECTTGAVYDRLTALLELMIEWGKAQGIPPKDLGDTLAKFHVDLSLVIDMLDGKETVIYPPGAVSNAPGGDA